jgi:hypothetical protein
MYLYILLLLVWQLLEVGALWHLLPPLFKYDYTLAEGGVQASQETNRQEVRARPR